MAQFQKGDSEPVIRKYGDRKHTESTGPMMTILLVIVVVGIAVAAGLVYLSFTYSDSDEPLAETISEYIGSIFGQSEQDSPAELDKSAEFSTENRAGDPKNQGQTLGNSNQDSHPVDSVDADIQVTNVPIPSPTVVSIGTPTPTAIPTSIQELKQYALELINKDRADHGIGPVVMGDNIAAQIHAEESVEFTTDGHWYVSGEKPYMVYSRTGGRSYIAENSASGGWTLEEQRDCKSSSRGCLVRDPKKLIEMQQYTMMYDDAHADWGHRDQILNPKHTKVNIGVAFTEDVPWWVGFYQHFEADHFVAITPPTIRGTELSFTIENQTGEYEFSDSSIGVFYDPPPTELSGEQREKLSSYCTGGGTNCELPQEQRIAAWIIRPPEPGYHYGNLESNRFVATSWSQTNNLLKVEVNLETAVQKEGVYTVMVWGTHKKSGETTSLIGLSVTKP